MSVRKRTWTTAKGEQKEAWIVDYADQHGARHMKTFPTQREAKGWHATTTIEVKRGVHTASSRSVTVLEAGWMWLETAEKNKLERATIDHYRQHLNLHVAPHLGRLKLSELTVPVVRQFEDRVAKDVSPATVRKVLSSLSGILADAQERGLVAHNVVRDLRRSRRNGGKERGRKLKAGVDIPTPDEIRRILAAAQGRWRPLLLVAVFCGLRASELRGLRWKDVDFEKAEIRVHQRMDRYNTAGPPKSAAGERAVRLPAQVLAALKEWRLQCPKGALDLVFPNGAGKVENHANIVTRGLWPIEVTAGVADIVKDADGKVVLGKDGEPVWRARYLGLHALRHFFASWCINRRTDGGLELPLKVVQERLGHSTLAMTADRYGHLFPHGDDAAELEVGAQSLLG
ncbi:MAG TPA: site-specific integrase [Xanthobacteraceae bacterium]